MTTTHFYLDYTIIEHNYPLDGHWFVVVTAYGRNLGPRFPTKFGALEFINQLVHERRAVRKPRQNARVPVETVKGSSGDVGVGRETNDCVPAALAAAMRISYEDALAMCALGGRKPRKGTYVPDVITVANDLGYKTASLHYTSRTFPRVHFSNWKAPRPYRMTFAKFAQTYSKGSFLITSNRHAVAVVDGKIYSNHSGVEKGLQRVTQAWEFFPQVKVHALEVA